MHSLELKGLVKSWPELKVHVDLHAGSGRILGIVGPSGCGKSTMLRMVAGLERPDSGSIIVGGKDVTMAEPSARGIGMVFQDYALFPHLDVAGNVGYGLRYKGQRKKLHIEKLLQSVRLTGFNHRKPHELSGGERQRVALARTLAVEPGVILFDEPLSSLDGTLRRQLRSEIAAEQKRLGFTAVYVTHDLEEAMAISDTLAIMDHGTILQCATPRDLWDTPASVAVARLMGSGPCLPIVRFEKDSSGIVACTATGRFTVPEACARTFSASPGSTATFSLPMYLYFGRNAAIPSGNVQSPETGYLEARCLRSDFAGDAVDCSMEAGGEYFTLRFTAGTAPSPGENCFFRIKNATCLS